jgi:microcystin-dependent protein
MSEPFIGEIRMFGFQFPPRGHAFCNGQLAVINQNAALFSILGTTYGGNGTTTFGLPDLRGRTPNHWGQGPGLPNYSLGQVGGEESHTLLAAEMPSHTHTVVASSNAADLSVPTGNFFASGGQSVYNTTAALDSNLAPSAVSIYGSGGAHENMQPFLVLNFCIALVGIFPTRN